MNSCALTKGDSEIIKAYAYYCGNCGKVGIFTQPCGWEGTFELWNRSIGDSHYVAINYNNTNN